MNGDTLERLLLVCCAIPLGLLVLAWAANAPRRARYRRFIRKSDEAMARMARSNPELLAKIMLRAAEQTTGRPGAVADLLDQIDDEAQ